MNNKVLNKLSLSHLIFTIFIISIYFIGFKFKDYVPGGSPEDFTAFIWNNINNFQNDLKNSLVNYNKMADANFPGFYIISSFNPFAYSIENFHLFSLLLGFLTFIFFGLVLSKNDNSNNLLLNFSIASLILILPFFLTRVYWGTSAGLAWFIFVVLLFYFNKILELFHKGEKISLINISVLCFLSSLLLYTRASFVFFALYILFYFLLIIKKKEIIFSTFLIFSIFALPGLYLIFIWVTQSGENINAFNFIKFKNIFLNFPILTSYFTFYLFPLLLISLKYLDKDFFSHYLKIFFIFFIFYFILFITGKFQYLSNYEYGGGAILKLNYILFDKNYFLLLLSSIIGCCLIYSFLKKNFLENIILLLPIFLIYGLTDYPFQDYFEPLIIFLFFSGMLKSSLYNFFIKNKETVFYLYFFYFFSFLVFSVYFKNFY